MENSFIVGVKPPVVVEETTTYTPLLLTGNEWVTFTLPPVLVLSNINELHRKLKDFLGRRVRLSGEQVERIDSTALQLLVAFINDPNVTIGWVNPSLEIYNVARLLGLTSHLNLPSKL